MSIKLTGSGGSIKFTGTGGRMKAGDRIGGGGAGLSLPAGFVDGVGYTGTPNGPNLAPLAITWNGTVYTGSSFTFDATLSGLLGGDPVFLLNLVGLGPWNQASVPAVVEVGTSTSVALGDPYIMFASIVKPTLDGADELNTGVTNPGDISFLPSDGSGPSISHAGVGACQLAVTGDAGASLAGVPLVLFSLKAGSNGAAPRNTFAIQLTTLPWF